MYGKALNFDKDHSETSERLRIGKDLIKATVPFAEESVTVSWWHVGSTFAMLAAALTGAGLAPWWPLQLLFSLLAAMLMVRAFITYHDYMHRAILVRSRIAWILFRVHSALALTPPRSWKKSHNYHHGHVGQISSSSVGANPIMTTQMWHEASWGERTSYRIIRHPLTVLAGYATTFFLSITLLPLLRDPARHWDSLLALVGHAALTAVLWAFSGFDIAFFVVLLPMAVASALGSYLFLPSTASSACTYCRRRRGPTIGPPWNRRVTCVSTESCNGSLVTSVFTISITSTFAYLSTGCLRLWLRSRNCSRP